MHTLTEALQEARHVTDRGYTFLRDDLSPSVWSFERLADEAERRGKRLLELGMKKGDRLALIIPDSEEFVLSFLGAVTAGVIPVPMYPPLALGKLDNFIESASSILRVSKARFLLSTKQVSPILGTLLGRVPTLEAIKNVDALNGSPRAETVLPVASPSEPCFLQFTSGSTSDPKGVVVTHQNLIANAKALMTEGLAVDPARDIGVSWLPLYHDMGLIGFVVSPLVRTVAVIFIQTMTFVRRPQVWMETVSKYKATMTFAPNFAFGLASKRMSAERLKELDLSTLRVLGCGAEPINVPTVSSFMATFKDAGLRPEALMPCYGMAEATLAIAFDDLQTPIKTLTIDREAYESQNLARPVEDGDTARPKESVLQLVSCGKTFRGHELGIFSSDNQKLPDYSVGEICFRGPSVTAGYYENPTATAELLKDGWLHTGDLGFMANGLVYVSGRQKDLIILNGRNYYPQAIEWVVEHTPGVRKGNVVAFSAPGESTERLVVVAEAKVQPERIEELQKAVKSEVKTALGLMVSEVVLVPSGALPKTSSGKLQRRRTKQQFQAGTLGRMGDRRLGSTGTRLLLVRHFTQSAFARIRHRVKGALPGLKIPAFIRDIDQPARRRRESE